MSDHSAIIDAHAGDDLSSLGGEWEVDPTHSTLEFVVRYAMFTLVRGRFTSFSGAVAIDPSNLEMTQIAVDIDASSVDNPMASATTIYAARSSSPSSVIRTSRFDLAVPRCSVPGGTRSRVT